MLTSPALNLPGITHSFFTRNGGVSDGLYASLNCGLGSGDDIKKVRENRARAAIQLGAKPERLSGLYQIHSNRVIVADNIVNAQEADALVTQKPGIALGILTADCLPVLLAEPDTKIIGAAHAGWKGAVTGILENTIQTMCELGANREAIIAAIGPAIQQNSYEVGPEFYTRFIEENAANDACFKPSLRLEHYLFDLPGFAAMRLKNAGIASINTLDRDTCLEEDSFFSFRRATLRGEKAYGRQLSAIMIEE